MDPLNLTSGWLFQSLTNVGDIELSKTFVGKAKDKLDLDLMLSPCLDPMLSLCAVKWMTKLLQSWFR